MIIVTTKPFDMKQREGNMTKKSGFEVYMDHLLLILVCDRNWKCLTLVFIFKLPKGPSINVNIFPSVQTILSGGM